MIIHAYYLSGAMWTSYARVRLHKLLMKLHNDGARPHYVDTDAIIFSAEKGLTLHLPMGISFGKLKEDISGAEYKSYQSLGPKKVNLHYKQGEKVFQKGKFAGLSQDQICEQFAMIDASRMNKILQTQKPFKTAQWKTKWLSKSNRSSRIFSKYTIGFKKMGLTRIPIKTKRCIQSLPIGYNQILLQRVKK